MTDVATTARTALPGRGTSKSTPAIAFGALLLRDLSVLRKEFVQFIARTVMQPLLFVFVFAYVFPKIGQGVGGAAGSAAFSSILVPGVVAIACIFQGIQSVALPLVQDFGYSREIEDRVMAPLPVWSVAVEKVVAGAIQGLVAAAIVFPLALVVPATPDHQDVRPLLQITLLPLAAITAASLGLVLGTRVNPRQVPLLFGIVVIPIVFLGATYYPWANLTPIPWLKLLVLLNPLVYMSEGMRVSLTPNVPHMAYWAIYGGMLAFIAIFLGLGIDGFRNRVLS
jgi:ABC-2 type transport system permease protein